MAAAAPAWKMFEQNATGILTVRAGGDVREPLDIGRAVHPDLSLVSRCLRGDETAWEDLIRVHSRRVYGLCFRFTNSTSEAQDLTQEVFLRVFRTLKTFRSTEGSFATWLARVTRNLLIDNYRRSRQERVRPILLKSNFRFIEEEGAAASPRPDELVAGREASDDILQLALQQLSPDLREAVILRDLQEMEYREIADVLQIPEGTVKISHKSGPGRAGAAPEEAKAGIMNCAELEDPHLRLRGRHARCGRPRGCGRPSCRVPRPAKPWRPIRPKQCGLCWSAWQWSIHRPTNHDYAHPV